MALKTFRPTTPSLRQLVQVDRSQLWKGAPIKMLVEGKTKSGGRNNYGRITTRHIGGGHKQAYRLVDFRRTQVRRPRPRSSGWNTIPTARRSSPWSNTRTATSPTSWRRSAWPSATRSSPAMKADVKPGNAMQLACMPIGTIVHNIELKAGGGGKIARSAGAYVQLVGRDAGWAILQPQLRRDAARARRVHGDRRCGLQPRPHRTR